MHARVNGSGHADPSSWEVADELAAPAARPVKQNAQRMRGVQDENVSRALASPVVPILLAGVWLRMVMFRHAIRTPVKTSLEGVLRFREGPPEHDLIQLAISPLP
jgi:hypothetical protein